MDTLSPTIATNKLTECRDFYLAHFAARVSFDCGWYVVLELGGPSAGARINLMAPRDGQAEFAGGVTWNLEIVDPDAEHARLIAAGLPVLMPLEDHPWGDRGFATLDPAGVVVYLYRPIPPAAEFAAFHR